MRGAKTVTLPIELSIGGVFYGCSSVEAIYYLAGGSGVMPDRSVNADPESGETDCEGTLESASIAALKAVAFDEGCTHIGSMAFSANGEGCLEVLILPETLESIGEYAFRGQSALAVPLVFPEGFTALGESAFYESGITAVTLPEGVESIPDLCFYGCAGLAEINLPDSLRHIGSLAFVGARITRLELPKGLETIGEDAFASCELLKEVSAPIELEPNSADQYLKGGAVTLLRLLKGGDGTMPDRDLLSNAFDRLGVLETLEFEEGITRIGNYAFAATSDGALKDVHLPSTLQSIGDCAFCGHSSLRHIDLPEALASLGASAFARTGLEALTLPAGLMSVGDVCFDDNVNLRQIRFLGSAPVFEALESGSAAFQGVTAEAIYPASAAGWTKEARSSAGGCLFWHPDELSSLTLPTGLVDIQAEAFAGTSAGRVVLPDGVTAIGDRAFAGDRPYSVVFHIPESVVHFGAGCLPA